MTANVTQTGTNEAGSLTRQPMYQGTTKGTPTLQPNQDVIVGDWFDDITYADWYVVTAYTAATGASTSNKVGTLSGNLHTAIAAAIATATTVQKIIVQKAIIPAVTFKVGSKIEIDLFGTNNGVTADTQALAILAGTVGDITDQSVATAVFTGVTGANIPFAMKIVGTVRTLSATGTAEFAFSCQNNGTTGIQAVTNTTVLAAGTNLATTTATFLSLTSQSSNAQSENTYQIADMRITQ